MTSTRSVVRRLARPITGWADRRIQHVARQAAGDPDRLDRFSAELAAWLSRNTETNQYLGVSLTRLRDVIADLNERQEWYVTQVEVLLRETRAAWDRLAFLDSDVRRVLGESGTELTHRDGQRVELEHLDRETARFMNLATGYEGLAAQAGVFINEPVTVEYREAEVAVANVNERIVEIPFVFREAHRLAAGARVLDVGAAESSVSLSLASLGYRVTAVDPRGYALHHPLLTERRIPLGELEGESFDGAILLSVIEHVGIDHYDQPSSDSADIDLVAQLRTLLLPGGLLLLTTPFGKARHAGFQRIYDDVRLRRLLEGWSIDHVEVAERGSDVEWVHADTGIEPVDDDVYRVVMVVATRLPG